MWLFAHEGCGWWLIQGIGIFRHRARWATKNQESSRERWWDQVKVRLSIFVKIWWYLSSTIRFGCFWKTKRICTWLEAIGSRLSRYPIYFYCSTLQPIWSYFCWCTFSELIHVFSLLNTRKFHLPEAISISIFSSEWVQKHISLQDFSTISSSFPSSQQILRISIPPCYPFYSTQRYYQNTKATTWCDKIQFKFSSQER